MTLERPKLHSPLRRSGWTEVETAHRLGKLDEEAGILRRECVSICSNGAGLSASSLLSVTLVLFCVESLAPVSQALAQAHAGGGIIVLLDARGGLKIEVGA